MINEEGIALKLVDVENRSKGNTRRIEQLEKWKEQIANEKFSKIDVLANDQKAIKEDVAEIKIDVKGLLEKPANRWEGLVKGLIAGFIGAFISYLVKGG